MCTWTYCVFLYCENVVDTLSHFTFICMFTWTCSVFLYCENVVDSLSNFFSFLLPYLSYNYWTYKKKGYNYWMKDQELHDFMCYWISFAYSLLHFEFRLWLNGWALIGEKELLGVVDEIKLNMAGVLMVEKLQEIEKLLPIFRTQTISKDTVV